MSDPGYTPAKCNASASSLYLIGTMLFWSNIVTLTACGALIGWSVRPMRSLSLAEATTIGGKLAAGMYLILGAAIGVVVGVVSGWMSRCRCQAAGQVLLALKTIEENTRNSPPHDAVP